MTCRRVAKVTVKTQPIERPAFVITYLDNVLHMHKSECVFVDPCTHLWIVHIRGSCCAFVDRAVHL